MTWCTASAFPACSTASSNRPPSDGRDRELEVTGRHARRIPKRFDGGERRLIRPLGVVAPPELKMCLSETDVEIGEQCGVLGQLCRQAERRLERPDRRRHVAAVQPQEPERRLGSRQQRPVVRVAEHVDGAVDPPPGLTGLPEIVLERGQGKLDPGLERLIFLLRGKLKSALKSGLRLRPRAGVKMHQPDPEERFRLLLLGNAIETA